VKNIKDFESFVKLDEGKQLNLFAPVSKNGANIGDRLEVHIPVDTKLGIKTTKEFGWVALEVKKPWTAKVEIESIGRVWIEAIVLEDNENCKKGSMVRVPSSIVKLDTTNWKRKQ
jgi:hypothetical protein